jgi:hypothetical protein
MRKLMFTGLFVIASIFFSCSKSNKVKNNKVIKIKKNSLELPLGEISREQIDKYYPNIRDTFKEKAICGTERLKMKQNDNIIVTIFHNTGTFDQMVLCTHNKKTELIDRKYIGKATGFDNGQSHTIDFKILNDNQIEIKQVDYKDIGINTEEIDTVKYYKDIFTIKENGEIVLKRINMKFRLKNH